ncbi:helix-hairpin-helix domain-containing protein [Nesterenkonia jeotgali]|uniref:Competence protein ComEA n=1 Tax=Nesterenkonia jeotgali TaxID=317018 RepID=A0A839FN61_9MICC|nr:helix-hairpin-helix domain-containing protein [Nesterenkonia jeotgali]MBA8920875.1 competence protein ComEA [Nesterenkonia jeotgali]
MEVWPEDQLTRRERLRADREREHSAPARIRLRLAGVLVIVIGLLTWLAVSWLAGLSEQSAVPEPPQPGQGQPGLGASENPAQASGPEQPEGPGVADPGQGAGSSQSPGAPANARTPLGAPEAQDASPVVVHVGGAVESPGVVELSAGARVHEAIEAAGGMTSKADPGGLNLATPVQDGALIWVPTPEELKAGTGPPAAGATGAPGPNAGAGEGAGQGTGPEVGQGAPPGSGQGAGDGSGQASGEGAAVGAGAGELINLNTADAATLDELPGIGPALSQRIIDHRETNGAFGSLEELAGVSGIGPVILADVEGLVTW